jgi:hypothetical protein
MNSYIKIGTDYEFLCPNDNVSYYLIINTSNKYCIKY